MKDKRRHASDREPTKDDVAPDTHPTHAATD